MSAHRVSITEIVYANICTVLFCRDVYNNIPPLEPEKLKVFNTVREITGMLPSHRLLSVCVLVAVVFVTSGCDSAVCVCVICRYFEHSVLAR